VEIRIWQSYSCNNSSSYYLVARFEDRKVLKEVGSELEGFFAEHAQQMDAGFDDDEGDYPSGPSEAATALAKKYGFTWKSLMMWGDEMLTGDEPEIHTQDDTLILYHSYCGGGLPPEVPKYLAARGGRVEKEPKDHGLSVSVVANLPKGGAKSPVKKDLDKLFALMVDEGDDYVDGAEPPWLDKRNKLYGKAAYFSDEKTVGFFLPTEPRHLAPLQEWLTKRGVVDPSIRLCAWDDHAKFRAIAAARCTECEGPLEYLDPRITRIASEQLSCAKCGGMFDLATFLRGTKKKSAAKEKLAVKAKKASAPTKKKASARK